MKYLFMILLCLSCSRSQNGKNQSEVAKPPVEVVAIDELMMIRAIEAGDTELLKTYLESYESVNEYLNITRPSQETLLAHAYEYAPTKLKIEIMTLLLDNGAEPSMALSKSEDLIFRSFRKLDEEVVTFLLDYTRDYKFDERFFKIAFEKRNHRFLEIVSDYKMNINKSQLDRLLFSTLLEESHNEPAEGDDRLHFSKYLIDELGADINAYDGSGQTPLIFLAKVGSYRAIEELMTDYPQLNLEQRDLNNQTALMHAVINGRISTVQLLLSRCVDRHMRDSERRRACWYACQQGNKAIKRDLIKLLNTKNTFEERVCGPALISLRRCLCSPF